MNGEFVPIKGKQLEMIEKSLRSRKKKPLSAGCQLILVTVRVVSWDIRQKPYSLGFDKPPLGAKKYSPLKKGDQGGCCSFCNKD
ncbi:MAG: hypothetical protein ACUZ8I_06855 [Candidatus Scalindua sp.]